MNTPHMSKRTHKQQEHWERLSTNLSSSGFSVSRQHVHDSALSCSIWSQQTQNLPWEQAIFFINICLVSLKSLLTVHQIRGRPLRTQNEMFLVATFLLLLSEKPSLLPLYCFLRLLTTTTGFCKSFNGQKVIGQLNYLRLLRLQKVGLYLLTALTSQRLLHSSFLHLNILILTHVLLWISRSFALRLGGNPGEQRDQRSSSFLVTRVGLVC